MRFSTVFVSLLGALHAAAQTFSATGPNPIISPSDGASIAAGKTTTITWTPTTSGPVTLTLRYGPSQNLAAGTVIASGIQNSGSYSWSVPQDIGSGSYTVEIKGSDGVANYSPIFAVTGGTGTQGGAATTTAASTTTSASKGSSSTTTADSTSSGTTSSSKSTTSPSSSGTSTTSKSSSSSSTSSSTAAKAPSNVAVPMRAGGGMAALGLGAFALLV